MPASHAALLFLSHAVVLALASLFFWSWALFNTTQRMGESAKGPGNLDLGLFTFAVSFCAALCALQLWFAHLRRFDFDAGPAGALLTGRRCSTNGSGSVPSAGELASPIGGGDEWDNMRAARDDWLVAADTPTRAFGRFNCGQLVAHVLVACNYLLGAVMGGLGLGAASAANNAKNGTNNATSIGTNSGMRGGTQGGTETPKEVGFVVYCGVMAVVWFVHGMLLRRVTGQIRKRLAASG
jgi:hypothetical protein